MKNNSNLIIAVIFLVGFLFFWDFFVMSRYGSPKPTPSSPVAAKPQQNNETPSSVFSPAELKKLANEPPSASEKIVTLKAPGVEASFQSKGAEVISWKIKEGDHWLETLLPEKTRTRNPFQMFPDLIYAVEKKSEGQAIFKAQRSDGLVVIQTVELLSKPPFHSVSLQFSNPTQNEIKVQSSFGWANGVDHHVSGTPFEKRQETSALAEQRGVAFSEKIMSWKPGFIFQRNIDLVQEGPLRWFGVDSFHFLAAFISPDKKIDKIRVQANRDVSPTLVMPIDFTLVAQASQEFHFQLYVGPKKYDELKTFGYDLDQSVNFGFFGAISKILLYLLKRFEALTGNYGWAIIILTFFIQILVFPLTIKNFKHAIRMKELQPQIKKIQEQFKSDPKRLQVETFNLYRRNGMKFMGMEGCFPMLLQIPIFFAFYSTLQVAYELRGAPWIFWIRDLGAHDPYYILPILMGLGMFLQQKMTSVAVDPAQARMMMFMPVMMTFMFLKLPAGLVLYWCVNSLTTIVIQKVMQSRAHPSPAG